MGERSFVATVIVRAAPEHVEVVSDAILRDPSTEIIGDSLIGTLIVILEAASESKLMAGVERIVAIPEVRSVNLAFQMEQRAAPEPQAKPEDPPRPVG